MSSVFGTTFSDLQNARTAEQAIAAQNNAAQKQFIAQVAGQRAHERLGNRDLDLQQQRNLMLGDQFNRQLSENARQLSENARQFDSTQNLRKFLAEQDIALSNRKLSENARQFDSTQNLSKFLAEQDIALSNRRAALDEKSQREDAALARFVAETGNEGMLQEIRLQKQAQENSFKLGQEHNRNNAISAMGNFLSAINQGLTSGNRSTAIQTIGNQIRDLNRQAAIIRQYNNERSDVLNAVLPEWQAHINRQRIGGGRLDSLFGPRANEAVASRLNVHEWLMNNAPDLLGKVEMDENFNLTLKPSAEERAIGAELSSLKANLDSLMSGNQFNDSEIMQARQAVDMLEEMTGLNVGRFVPEAPSAPPQAPAKFQAEESNTTGVSGTPVIKLRRQARQSIADGKDPAAVAARFKELTGLDL